MDTQPKQVMIGRHLVEYTPNTAFVVETLDANPDATWRHRFTVIGNPMAATLYHRGVNVGPGSAKRLRVGNLVVAAVVGAPEPLNV